MAVDDELLIVRASAYLNFNEFEFESQRCPTCIEVIVIISFDVHDLELSELSSCYQWLEGSIIILFAVNFISTYSVLAIECI